MKFQIALCEVVETKFDPLYKSNVIVVDISHGVYIHIAIPFEHTVKTGDKIPLEVEIPLALARLT